MQYINGWNVLVILNDMVKYYRHKDKSDVICEVFGNVARFGRWVWNKETCSEVYTHKNVTDYFMKSFEEITQKQFNNVWGNKLQNA